MYTATMSKGRKALELLRKYAPIAASQTLRGTRWLLQQTTIRWREIEEGLPDTRGGRWMRIGLRLLVPTGVLLAVLSPIAGYLGLSLAFPAALHGFGWIFFLYGFVES